MPDKRLLALDILRIFACLCILVIHFNASVSGYDITQNFTYHNQLVPNYYLGIYLGNIGVGLFFILTGACLQQVYGKLDFTPKFLIKFYYKRAKSIYPIYWITFIIFTLFSFFYYKFYPDFKIGHLLSSFIAIDGYLMTLRKVGYETYQCGEWFLGCILCLYIIFPFISLLVNNWPKKTVLVTIICILLNYNNEMKEIWFFFQIPYLIFGILFIKYFYNHLNSLQTLMMTGFAILLTVIFQDMLTNPIKSLVICIILFTSITYITELSKFYISKRFIKMITYFSGLSYPMFLIHHKLIMVMSQRYDLSSFPYRYTVLMFIIYIIFTIVLSTFVLNLKRKVQSIFQDNDQ